MAAPIAGFQSLGQPHARAAALRAAQSGRLQRTLLVHGPAGAGKGAFTDDLLALLFCQADDPTSRTVQRLPRLPRCPGAHASGPGGGRPRAVARGTRHR